MPLPPPHEDTRTNHEIGSRVYLVADVAPLDVHGTRTVAVGTLLWLVGLLVSLAFHNHLKAAGHEWWPWTCLAGLILGLLGWGYCAQRSRALRRRSDSPAP